MVKFCHKNDILIATELGFQSNMSCIEAIAKTAELMRREIVLKEIGRAN